MAARRASILAALAAAAILGAAAAWHAATGPDPASGAAAAPPRRAIPWNAARDDANRRRPPEAPAAIAAPRPPALLPGPPLPLEPPATEPMIDIPAGPPPEQGAGDDLEESGLPRPLFEAKVALERIAPAPARLDAAEARLGRAISRQAREALAASFQRHNEAAAIAIGDYRLQAISQDEAAAALARAQDLYRRDAAAALGVTAAELEGALAVPAGDPRP